MCRSRRELSNEYLLAKIGVDTAENEPCKVCPLSAYRSPRFWMTYEDFCAHFNWVGVCDRSLTLDSVAVGVRGEGTSCGPALGCLRLLDGISFWLVTQNS